MSSDAAVFGARYVSLLVSYIFVDMQARSDLLTILVCWPTGANSSMEDGAALGYILAALHSRSQLPEAMNVYQHIRKTRGEAIVKETFAQRDDIHLPDGPEQQARDKLMLSKLGKEIDCKFPSRWQCPEVQPWLFGYDAKKATEEALRRWPLESKDDDWKG